MVPAAGSLIEKRFYIGPWLRERDEADPERSISSQGKCKRSRKNTDKTHAEE